nr:MAG TPA: hypothetical protein [Caudoviricetes sp.]
MILLCLLFGFKLKNSFALFSSKIKAGDGFCITAISSLPFLFLFFLENKQIIIPPFLILSIV